MENKKNIKEVNIIEKLTQLKQWVDNPTFEFVSTKEQLRAAKKFAKKSERKNQALNAPFYTVNNPGSVVFLIRNSKTEIGYILFRKRFLGEVFEGAENQEFEQTIKHLIKNGYEWYDFYSIYDKIERN